jgi:hypothetical protein
MRSRLELTRFGLRLLGVWLLLWCWWNIVGMLSMIAGSASVGNWHLAGSYMRSGWHDASGLLIHDPMTTGNPTSGLNWPLLTWWFRLGLGLYLVFRGRGLARLLWRGIGSTTRCANCGYDRSGLAKDAACPECGRSDG